MKPKSVARRKNSWRSSWLPTHSVASASIPRRIPKAGAFYLITLRSGADLAKLLPGVSALQRELDVVLLHNGILEPALGIAPKDITAGKNVTFEREATAAIAAVDSGHAQVAFLLNACDVEQVIRVATAGEVMPQNRRTSTRSC